MIAVCDDSTSVEIATYSQYAGVRVLAVFGTVAVSELLVHGERLIHIGGFVDHTLALAIVVDDVF